MKPLGVLFFCTCEMKVNSYFDYGMKRLGMRRHASRGRESRTATPFGSGSRVVVRKVSFEGGWHDGVKGTA